MAKTAKAGSISRVVAVMLALVWACAGVAGLVVAFTHGIWVAAIAGIFALWYAILWVRVGIQARLLTWSESATPWRAR
jgi:hypothetical protein